MAASDLLMDHAAFNLWLTAECGDNFAELSRLKRVLPIVLEECVTEKERSYIMAYFVQRKNVSKIAKEFSVNPSSVSRGIKRGLNKAYRYLRFVSPLFIRVSQKRSYLKREV